jgi:uncharacterized damage-inducible protein DinB
LTGTPVSELDAASVDDWSVLADYREQVTGRFREVLAGLTDEELFLRRNVEFEDGFRVCSWGELAANILLHERGHHGDITTLLYQLGIEPPRLDYRWHLGRTAVG